MPRKEKEKEPERAPVNTKYLQGLGLNHDLADRLSTLCIDAGELMEAAQSSTASRGLLLEVPEPSRGTDDPYHLTPPVRQTKIQQRKSLARLMRPIGMEDEEERKKRISRLSTHSSIFCNRESERSLADGDALSCPESPLPGISESQAFLTETIEAEDHTIIRLTTPRSPALESAASAEAPKSKLNAQKNPEVPKPRGPRPSDLPVPPEGWYRFNDVLEARGGKLDSPRAESHAERGYRADKPGGAKDRIDDNCHPLRSRLAGTKRCRAPSSFSARAPSSTSNKCVGSPKGQMTPRLPPINVLASTEPVSLDLIESATMSLTQRLTEDMKLVSVVRHPRWIRTGAVR